MTALADGSRPDPGRLVVKDGRGRYYSTDADGWGPEINVWSAEGRYLSSFGRTGEGPGEFAEGRLSLFVDDGDSLHVRDVSNWSVFSPDHVYVRRAPSRLMGLGDRKTTALLYDGSVLASDGYRSTGTAYFRIVDRGNGSLVRTFGTTSDGTGAGGHYGHDRAVAYQAGYRSFWAAPAVQGSDEYTLEEWDWQGDEVLPAGEREPKIIQSLRRDAPWFKWTGDENSSPSVRYLHITDEGLLFVYLWRPSEEYIEAVKRLQTPEGHLTLEALDEIEALGESLTYFVIEVIDVGSAQLLASSDRYPAGEVVRGGVLLPHGFFRNEMTGYVYGTGDDGLPYVEIVEAVLEQK